MVRGLRTLDKLLEIEEKEEIYQYTFSYKKILMYPFIRSLLLQSAIEDMNKLSSPYILLKTGIINKIIFKLKSFLFRYPNKMQADIVFFGSDISNILHGNIYFNRLTECFANEYPLKTVLIEQNDRMNYKRPRTYPKVFTKDFLDIIVRIKSAKTKANSEDLKNIDDFLKCLKQRFNYEFITNDIWYTIKSQLIIYSIELPFLLDEYIKILKKISPKIIFLEDACYGGDKVPLIMAAKELNIAIGEYQHGFISLAHPAYNYSEKLPSCYKYYMPDIYMSYGEYWTKNSRIPLKIFEIGNPYLSETTSQKEQTMKKEQILYISSTVEPERYANEIIWLNEKFADKGYSILFRIHPSEVHRLKTVYKPIIDAGIKIDTQPLYETLKSTKYLISDCSTVLFEALMFNCIVFVIETPLGKENLDIKQFNSAFSIEEIANNIILGNYKKNDPSFFWSDNWKLKYRQIINKYLEDN